MIPAMGRSDAADDGSDLRHDAEREWQSWVTSDHRCDGGRARAATQLAEDEHTLARRQYDGA